MKTILATPLVSPLRSFSLIFFLLLKTSNWEHGLIIGRDAPTLLNTSVLPVPYSISFMSAQE